MHGVIRPLGSSDTDAKGSLFNVALRALHPFRWVLLLVALPTLIVALYYYGFASDQYESNAAFVVRRAEAPSRNMLGVGQIFGLSLGASQSQSDAYLVGEYLLSHDAVARLRRDDRLVERFRRPDTDLLSKLWSADPKPETLLSFFRQQVTVGQDDESGISRISVRAFSPEDSYALTTRLLRMGEQRINELNARTYRNQIADSRRDLDEANAALQEVQKQLTAFRRDEGDIDPAGTGRAQLGLVTEVTGQVVAARARLASMGRFLSPNSPQYRALASQVRAMEAQLAGQSSRLTGSGPSVASNLGNYEDLVIRKEFAAQRYAAAAAAFEQARSDALKQQLYLTRVVEPDRPVKSEYPKRARNVATVFFSLLLAYAIGWLVVAGIKEHSI